MTERERRRKKREKFEGFPPSGRMKLGYRFSKNYPSGSNEQGYKTEKNEKKIKPAVYISIFLVVLIVSFFVSAVLMNVSSKPAAEIQSGNIGTEKKLNVSGNKAVFLSGDTLSYRSVDDAAGEYVSLGINTVVISFKDASGSLYFMPSDSSLSYPESLTMASKTAGDVIDGFQEYGLRVYAYFCCYADDIYARNNQNLAAYYLTEDASGENGEVHALWYDSTKDAHAWMSPFSSDYNYYLNSLIKDVFNLGVDGIILDCVSLPYATDDGGAVFPGNEDGDRNNVNDAMASFAESFVNSYSSISTGLADDILNVLEYTNSGEPTDLMKLNPAFSVVKFDIDSVPENTPVGSNLYSSPSKTVPQFTKAAFDEITRASDSESLSTAVTPLFTVTDKIKSELSAVKELNMDSYIIYSPDERYNSDYFD